MREANAFFWVTGDCKTETNAENYFQIKSQNLAIKIVFIPLAYYWQVYLLSDVNCCSLPLQTSVSVNHALKPALRLEYIVHCFTGLPFTHD